MNNRAIHPTASIFAGILATYGIFLVPAHGEGTAWSTDPSKVVGSDTCIECHKAAHTVLEGTHHFGTYTEMPESDKAIEIAGKMGIEALDLTTSDTCRQCHFTVQKDGDKLRAISGISCESCHGAAADWVKVHSDEKKPKEARLAEAVTKGMNRPGDMYALFSNCLECHTAPNEKLVNVGGHPAGSDFELVSYSQGEIRHTFNDGETVNEVASAEKLRVMFVLGKALEVEYALKAISGVTEAGGVYQTAMVKRYQTAVQFLQQIQATVGEHAQLAAIVAAGTNVGGGSADELKAAATAVGKAAQEFSKSADGSKLAALDGTVQQWLAAKKGNPAPYTP